MSDPRTPMAWQHRDLNYHQSGYQDKYGPGAEMNGSSRLGPPSTSDRLSHRTDKSWRNAREQPNLVPYNGHSSQYAPSRPSFSSGRPHSRPRSPSASSTSTSSSSTSTGEDSENPIPRMPIGPPQPFYGYNGYMLPYPGAPPGYPPIGPMYPGTMKTAHSVPTIGLATWDGEPCPVHGEPPMSLPGPPQMVPGMPHMMPPGPQHFGYLPPLPPRPMGPMSLPPLPGSPRRSNSINDLRMFGSPPPLPGPIYGTLPLHPPGIGMPADRRSIAGSALTGQPPLPRGSHGIPPQFLPPMVRPRPIVMAESGAPEPLPVRSPSDKNGSLPSILAIKAADGESTDDLLEGRSLKCKGCGCVSLIILGLICIGIIVALSLVIIL